MTKIEMKEIIRLTIDNTRYRLIKITEYAGFVQRSIFEDVWTNEFIIEADCLIEDMTTWDLIYKMAEYYN